MAAKKTPPKPPANGAPESGPPLEEDAELLKMTKPELHRRIRILEAQVAWLRKELGRLQVADGPWWQKIAASHADAPEAFEEATRLGREWRESFRPRPRRRKAKTEDVHS